MSFESVAFVEAAGISTSRIDYSYECYQECELFQYFRLKQVDEDGKEYDYDTKSVTCGDGLIEIKIEPTLVKSHFTIHFGEHRSTANVEVIDALGVTKQQQVVSADAPRAQVNISALLRGVYFVRITSSDNEQVVKKIVKQ